MCLAEMAVASRPKSASARRPCWLYVVWDPLDAMIRTGAGAESGQALDHTTREVAATRHYGFPELATENVAVAQSEWADWSGG